MNGYTIEISKKSFMGCMSVSISMPSLPGVRRLEGHKLSIDIGEDGTINIPATGDLCATEDVPALIKALTLAAELARGDIQVQGLEVSIHTMAKAGLKVGG